MPSKIRTILLFCALFTAISSEAQVFNHPVEYLNFLGAQSVKVSEDMWDYTRTISKGKGARKIENRRKDLLNQLSVSIKAVRARPAFNKQEYLKVAYVSYYQTNINLLNEDYAKLMNMEEIAEKSYDAMEQYIMIQEKANAKLGESADSLNANVQKYAAQNKIILTDEQTKTSKRLKRASEAFAYYQPIYLIMFKAMVQENNFLAAYNSNKTTEAEQAKSALLTYSTEGLNALAAKPAYNNDAKLKAACGKLLTYYKAESETLFGEMLSHKMKDANFQKLNAAFSKKKKNELTQEEVNEFNAAVTDLNQSGKNMNSKLDKGNMDRKKELDGWNGAVEDFLKKHAA